MQLVVLAGDRREVAAAAVLRRWGHGVRHHGAVGGGTLAAAALCADLAAADAVLGPALGTSADGRALFRPGPDGPASIDAAWMEACRPGCPWLIGRAGPWLRDQAEGRGLRLLPYAARDDFARLNAVPTAEGAIAEAAARSGRTAWGSTAVVVGGGRCGLALADRLVAWGCRTQVVARSAAARAAAAALGAAPVEAEALVAAAAACDWLFNTVPAPVVDRNTLQALPSGGLVLDLASAPGGVDFEAAAALGVPAALLPGIPGRMFAATAGEIVATVAMGVLVEAGYSEARPPRARVEG